MMNHVVVVQHGTPPPLLGRGNDFRGAYRTELQYGTLPDFRRSVLNFGQARSNVGAYRTEVQYGTLHGAHDVGAFSTERFP